MGSLMADDQRPQTIELHEDLQVGFDITAIDDNEIVSSKALEDCTCNERQRLHKGVRPDGTADVCLSCQARGALNLCHDIATRE